ncbi:hypothetical protein [Bailinhaonella thermotolerans]|uniref:Cupin domain-containing protein n=1 Tax=Bailinhaonella thermotolerans TaxID=1070861 RepID=A0A3A4AJH8_9ACTN|nr:hypothetical protein [Bailinhaonella thermotolerans]RJL27234.1 hypothetical protein D5H75_25930 [Bailinhaonella thermotolerans]
MTPDPEQAVVRGDPLPADDRRAGRVFHVAKDRLEADNPVPGFETRTARLGDYTVVFETMPAGWPPTGAFDGLPGDRCPVAHWGYLFEGRFRAVLDDGTELSVGPGEAYYLPPGHLFQSLEPSRTVWFSPAAELAGTFEIVAGNVAALLSMTPPVNTVNPHIKEAESE